jgi:glycosyltransferase involved in cell wall biosynthesis
MKLSVIIPWRNRPEIETTLSANTRIFAAHELEVIVVNCAGDAQQLSTALSHINIPNLGSIELQPDKFNKSLALNLGVYAARAPYLFLLDTDVIFRDDSIPAALNLLETDAFVTIERAFESAPHSSPEDSEIMEVVQSLRIVATGQREASVETNRLRITDGSKSAPGLIFLARRHFIEIGGMNSDLQGWGWEDIDLLLRLQLGLGLAHRQVGSVTHLTHGDEVRYFGEFGHQSEQFNMAMCMENYKVGHFWGTYHDDVATWSAQLKTHST